MTELVLLSCTTKYILSTSFQKWKTCYARATNSHFYQKTRRGSQNEAEAFFQAGQLQRKVFCIRTTICGKDLVPRLTDNARSNPFFSYVAPITKSPKLIQQFQSLTKTQSVPFQRCPAKGDVCHFWFPVAFFYSKIHSGCFDDPSLSPRVFLTRL